MRTMLSAFLVSLLAACPSQSASSSLKLEAPNSKTTRGKALIDSIEITLLKKEPRAYRFKAIGSLPDSCTSLDQVIVTHKNNGWVVTITTKRPAGKMCAAVIVPFERELPEVKPKGGSAGTIEVNGVKKSFP